MQMLLPIAKFVNELHRSGFAHTRITPDTLLYCKEERTWKCSSGVHLTRFGALAPVSQIRTRYTAPAVTGTHARAERAMDNFPIGVIACTLFTAGLKLKVRKPVLLFQCLLM